MRHMQHSSHTVLAQLHNYKHMHGAYHTQVVGHNHVHISKLAACGDVGNVVSSVQEVP